jgi:hypothetical protein
MVNEIRLHTVHMHAAIFFIHCQLSLDSQIQIWENGWTELSDLRSSASSRVPMHWVINDISIRASATVGTRIREAKF